jgi:hypothetical protein
MSGLVAVISRLPGDPGFTPRVRLDEGLARQTAWALQNTNLHERVAA